MQVEQFLRFVPSEHIFITDFSLHSIGVILSRLKKWDLLNNFIDDLFINSALAILRLEPSDILLIIQNMKRYNLDFDDAYQYVAAKKHHLTMVSFDRDFDLTDLGRKTPGEFL